MRIINDLVGKVFGRLQVLQYLYSKKDRIYLCKCSCGNTKICRGSDLRSGKVSSCGCYKKQKLIERSTKGGYCVKNRRLYKIYIDMLHRCYNPKCKVYRWYGAKGVKVCDEWLNDIGSFFDFCYAHGYSDSLTIDRINSDGDYCPENCRFVVIGFNVLRGTFKRIYGRDGTDEEVMKAFKLKEDI